MPGFDDNRIILLVAVVVGFLLALRLFRVSRASQRAMTAAELRRRLSEGEDLLLLDVRGAGEFNGPLGHLAGAVNLPLPQLNARLAEMKDDLSTLRDTTVILVCLRGPRAFDALWKMEKAGFRNLRVLKGGMTAWQGAGYPTVRG